MYDTVICVVYMREKECMILLCVGKHERERIDDIVICK